MYRKSIPSSQCYEVWGGNGKVEREVQFSRLKGFLFGLPYKSAKGGDIHFLASCDDAEIAKIIIADVSGHGDIASRAARQIERLLHEYINELDDSKLLVSINDFLNRELRNGEFVTMVAATFHSHDRSLVYAYAGHPVLLRYNASRKQWQVLRPDPGDGVPLGIIGNTNYLQLTARLSRGDMLLFYTDGLLSIKKDSGGQLSIEELIALCQEATSAHSNPRAIATALLDLIRAASTSGFNDDLTLLLLEIV
jgi:serine phosphatase RsbU (regulator of sigma subunit)